MSEHKALIKWTLSQGDFLKGTYSREHTWAFDGGQTVPASSSPLAVRVPFSNPACVDPEEAYVASLSSCHMLTYLYVASRKGFEVSNYEDEAVGTGRCELVQMSRDLGEQETGQGDDAVARL